MNLIEALKQANGKPVRRKGWGNDGSALIMKCDGDLIWAASKDIATLCRDSFLADDWCVVEPKSKIEEAIEREVADYFGVSPMESHRSQVAEAMRRVVNLALDEAKKAAWGQNISMCDGDMEKCVLSPKYVGERIDALKVKE